ncbi:MAG: tRNA (adenine-N1)-methyltransferase [Candidatus Dadabacteria bacterium]|nr:tRNA (adenine-N1)-methyltransferase [Candidatus Dadabacteria bacterium]NIS09159.1 tRNA (adenine-N1)-methyltransferase [Candidatus Dadabacteria bacterium]NIY22466.1 methyltransferase domain-containing protein [Candidatus Dadabacteria bacterium]
MPIQENDYVLILAPDDKTFLSQVSSEKKLSTHLGMLNIADVIGKNYGDKIVSGLGNEFYLLEPTTWDKMMKIKRLTQIIYPKDASIIIQKTGLGEGMRVVETGTGSGSMTIALANAVKPGGKVYTYEKRDQFRENAMKNLQTAGLSEYVEFNAGDAREGFLQTDVDVALIDLPSPWDGVPAAAKALKGGGRIASLSPTFNQVEENYKHLEEHGFIYLETVEVLVRNILVREGKTRPTQRMISHTGYLTFGRKINK